MYNNFTLLGKVGDVVSLVSESTKEPMLRITIVDGNSEIEILAFGPLAQRHNTMAVGDSVFISGKISERKTKSTLSTKVYKNIVLIASQIQLFKQDSKED